MRNARILFAWQDAPATNLMEANKPVLIGAAILILMVVGFLMVRRIFARRRRTDIRELEIQRIDVEQLGDAGPPDHGPKLEFYHVPVRLSLVVLAPVGRNSTLPSSEEMPDLIDQLVPGLMSVFQSHQPQFQAWPPQLSTEGFMNSFRNHVALPGDHGKGTPWCSLAGKFESEGKLYLAGMICHADQRNSLGEFLVEHAGKWLDVLRVKNV